MQNNIPKPSPMNPSQETSAPIRGERPGARVNPEKPKKVGDCAFCPEPILEDQEIQRVKDGIAHDECYFRVLGEEIERNPIFMPRTVHE